MPQCYNIHTYIHTLNYCKEEDQWDDLKNVGESNYNPEDGTDQRVQSLVFMMMRKTIILISTPKDYRKYGLLQYIIIE